jgi:hypothetical protein
MADSENAGRLGIGERGGWETYGRKARGNRRPRNIVPGDSKAVKAYDSVMVL